MSQDQDPIDATRSFEPVDPYNIPVEHGGAPMPGYEGYQQGFEQQPYGAPQPPRPQGFKQRLTRLGPLKLALLGTAGVIVLGGAAWGTTAALQSGSSSSNTAATAPATDQSQTQSPEPGAGATSGGTGKHKAGKPVRVKVTVAESGTIWGTDAKGQQVVVTYDASTKWGTKKMPFQPENVTSGESIEVVGPREGDKIAATWILFSTPKPPRGPAASGTGTPGQTAPPPTAPPPTAASPTDPASPVGGNA